MQKPCRAWDGRPSLVDMAVFCSAKCMRYAAAWPSIRHKRSLGSEAEATGAVARCQGGPAFAQSERHCRRTGARIATESVTQSIIMGSYLPGTPYRSRNMHIVHGSVSAVRSATLPGPPMSVPLSTSSSTASARFFSILVVQEPPRAAVAC